MPPFIATTTARYGPSPCQSGDLLLPVQKPAPVVCLLHGGFWRVPHGREQWQAVAKDLARRGYAVWNIGYRRLGEPGGGWPGTFEDVAAGIAQLAELARHLPIDPGRVAVVGHSAGGLLALWAAAQPQASESGVRIRALAALAPVADLARAWELGLGQGAVAELLGGSPAERPAPYAGAAPPAGRAKGIRQAIFHGSQDRAVPIDLSRGFVQADHAAGGAIELVELEGAGHMDFLDPGSTAHAALCEWLSRELR